MPESIALHSLDPGMRRGDEKRINQKFLRVIPTGRITGLAAVGRGGAKKFRESVSCRFQDQAIAVAAALRGLTQTALAPVFSTNDYEWAIPWT